MYGDEEGGLGLSSPSSSRFSTSDDSLSRGTNSTGNTNAPILPFIKRLSQPNEMDFQSALDQMQSLLTTNPQKVYKTSYYRKQVR